MTDEQRIRIMESNRTKEINERFTSPEDILNEFKKYQSDYWCNGVSCICSSCRQCKKDYIKMLCDSYFIVKLL